MATVVIHLKVAMDAQYLREFLQHIRTFESARSKDVHAAIWVDGGNMDRKEMASILRSIVPPFEFFEESRIQ